MTSTNSSIEIVTDLSPVIRVYRDGRVERLFTSPYILPSPEDPTTGVSTKDIKISSNNIIIIISARLYLPKLTDPANCQKLPILVYFHGGGFCIGSPFSSAHYNYLSLLVSEAKVLVVSVGYSLAPEHPLLAAYEDCWEALQWVASHNSIDNSNDDSREPWLINHGDFEKLLIGGDSAGGNIVHHMAMKISDQSLPGKLKIWGGFLSFPYFSGSKYTEANKEESLLSRLWMFVYPNAPNGIDNPLINPLADDAPSLSRIGCSRIFVCVADKDELRETALDYVDALKKSGWKGEVELVEVEGEAHCFQLINPTSDKATSLIKNLASFINA